MFVIAVSGTPQIALPPGQGRALIRVQAMGSDKISPSITYEYASPVLRSVSPTGGPSVGGYTLTISGDNLGIDIGAEYHRADLNSVGVLKDNNSWLPNEIWIGSRKCPVVSVRPTTCQLFPCAVPMSTIALWSVCVLAFL